MCTGIILASGFSHRMKRDKLLLPVDGVPLVERVIRAAAESRLDDCIIVYREESIMKIGKKYGLRTVYNESAMEGQSASVKLGVINAPASISSYLFLVADQPYVNSLIIDELIRNHQAQPDVIIAASYGGQRGNPVLFPSKFRSEFLELSGDAGGRQIMASMPDSVVDVDFDDKLAGVDIDTPENYRQLFPGT